MEKCHSHAKGTLSTVTLANLLSHWPLKTPRRTNLYCYSVVSEFPQYHPGWYCGPCSPLTQERKVSFQQPSDILVALWEEKKNTCYLAMVFLRVRSYRCVLSMNAYACFLCHAKGQFTLVIVEVNLKILTTDGIIIWVFNKCKKGKPQSQTACLSFVAAVDLCAANCHAQKGICSFIP